MMTSREKAGITSRTRVVLVTLSILLALVGAALAYYAGHAGISTLAASDDADASAFGSMTLALAFGVMITVIGGTGAVVFLYPAREKNDE